MDPAGQFHSPYVGMGNNPVMMVDPDGEWVLSALKIASGVGQLINGIAAVREAFDSNNFWDGLGTFASSYVINTGADVAAVATAPVNMTNSVITSGIAAVQGDFDGAGNALRAGFISPIDADIATIKNGGISGFAASGVNSTVASVNSVQLGWNRAVGDDSFHYEGRVDIGDDGAQALVWFRRNATDANATVVGNSITLKRGYFESNDRRKQQIFLHETIHIRQQRRYGTGGQISRFYQMVRDPNPNSECGAPGRLTPCSDVEQAIENRRGDGGSINVLEVEAEIEEFRFRTSPFFWPTIPIFD